MISSRPGKARPRAVRERFGVVEVLIAVVAEAGPQQADEVLVAVDLRPQRHAPIWSFSQTVPSGTARVSVAFSPAMPSSLVLPVVPDVSVPTPLPACPSIRNDPCRPYEPIVNQSGVAALPASPAAGSSPVGQRGSASWPPDVFAVGCR